MRRTINGVAVAGEEVPVMMAAVAALHHPHFFGRTPFVHAERRTGSTFAVGQAAAMLLEHIPEGLIGVFASGERQARFLAEQIATVHIPAVFKSGGAKAVQIDAGVFDVYYRGGNILVGVHGTNARLFSRCLPNVALIDEAHCVSAETLRQVFESGVAAVFVAKAREVAGRGKMRSRV